MNVEATSFQMVGHMLVAVVSVGGDFTFQSQQFTIDCNGGLSYEGATFKIGQVFPTLERSHHQILYWIMV